MTYKIKITRFLIIFIAILVICLVYEFLRINSEFVNNLVPIRYEETVFLSIFLITVALLPLLLLLLFNGQPVYNTWKKFAIPYLIVYAFLALPLGKLSGGGIYGGASPSVGKEVGIMFLAGLFFFISLLIIIIKSIKLAGKSEEEKTENESE